MLAPVVLGINRTQDASACLLAGDDATVTSKERLTRRKHDWGSLGDLQLYVSALGLARRRVDLVVECYSSDEEAGRLRSYRRELRSLLGRVRVETVSHHLAHAYSAHPPSGMRDSAAMVIDFQGSRVRDVVESWSGRPFAPPADVEVASFYACHGGEIRCIEKQTWSRNLARPAGLGAFYHHLTRTIFPGEGQEGKVMALASLGDPRALRLPPLDVRGAHVHVPQPWVSAFAERRFRYRSGAGRWPAHLAAAGQQAFECALLEVARWLAGATGLKRLCFAGGVALNCVANGTLRREGVFDEIFIPPAPHDGGTALGCAVFGQSRLLGRTSGFRWRHDFLGPAPRALDPASGLRRGFSVHRPRNLPREVATRLARGEIVGLCHGRSESGPRALGNRSILADARDPGACDRINAEVKGREPFRPVAPVVLQENAGEWFDADRPCPYMQYTVRVRRGRRKRIPSAVHCDGSARVQTVTRRHHPVLYRILRAFRGLTGVPLLINTSLNGRDEPLVETPEEALDLMAASGIDALAVPPWIVSKRRREP